MTAFYKSLAIASIFVGQFSLASFEGTSSGGGTFGPETQVYCGFNDIQGHELQVTLVGDPSSLGEYSANAQEATLEGFYAPLFYAKISRMMSSENIIEFKGNDFRLLVDLTTATDIPYHFEGIVQAKGIAGNKPVSVSCTLSY